MSVLAAHSEVEVRLYNQWAARTPISFPNVKFEKPDGSWIRVSIQAEGARQMDIGTDLKTIRMYERIYLQVFTKLNIGNGEALTLAEVLRGIFNNWCGVMVKCRAAMVKDIGPDGLGWYQVNVVIPLEYDEQL